MNFYDFQKAFLFGVFMAFMIGPVFFMLIKTSLLKGVKAALAFDVGVILGDIVFMLLAYFGSRTFLEKIKDDPRLFIGGGLILVIYGIISYMEKKDEKNVDEVEISKSNNYFKLFLSGFFLNTINVGVLAGWLGAMVVVAPTLNMNPIYILWYFATVLIGYIATDIVKILLAKQLKNKLTPSVIHKVKRGMSIILIVFGVILMLKAFIPKEKINTIIKNVEQGRSSFT